MFCIFQTTLLPIRKPVRQRTTAHKPLASPPQFHLHHYTISILLHSLLLQPPIHLHHYRCISQSIGAPRRTDHHTRNKIQSKLPLSGNRNIDSLFSHHRRHDYSGYEQSSGMMHKKLNICNDL